jgi:O-antigen/teichoic acid export membrane protein
LNGMENIGTVNFRRDLRFDRVFGYNFVAKLVSLGLTITLAVVLRNYWALVAGIIVGQLARTVLSYVLHPYRPRLTFSKSAEIWSFSIWVFARGVGGYVVDQVDVIAVGGVAGSTTMGKYTVAKDVASSPVDELNAPLISVLFPVMARVQSDRVELQQLYLRTLGWSAIIGVSTGVGVAMVAPELVLLLLGSKWITITPLMGWLALTAGLATLTYSGFSLLDILGVPSLGAKLQWIRALLLALAIGPVAYFSKDLVTIAFARFAMTVLFVPALLMVIGRYTGVAFKPYAEVLWRPFAAGLVLALVVSGLNSMVPIVGVSRLVFDVAAGIGSYGGTLLGLWYLSGRPASAERDLIDLLAEGWRRAESIRAR